jgi:DNA topoisomerase-1
MRLKRSDVSGPGLRRVRRGKGFSYHHPDGTPVTDPETLERVKQLAIPPAWRRVWICPHPAGHIQAVGTDAAGRRQYLYHPTWQRERSEEKFDRVLRMSPALPAARARIAHDLTSDGLGRDRVLALALYLLDRGYFRAGGEVYSNKDDGENNSYGIATLLCEHVRIRGSGRKCSVLFDYPAKHGIQRIWQIDDPAVVAAVGDLLRASPEGRLLVCRTDGGWAELHAEDLNARFKELLGGEYSVKDMRTWHGTVLAAAAFCDADPPVNKTVRKRVQAAVMREVSEELGNTPAVARSSYVDPRVVQAYENGMTIAVSARRAARTPDRDAAQEILEKGTAAMIRKVSAKSGRKN